MAYIQKMGKFKIERDNGHFWHRPDVEATIIKVGKMFCIHTETSFGRKWSKGELKQMIKLIEYAERKNKEINGLKELK